MSVEQHLRDTFERHADHAAAPEDMHALVLGQHRRSRRRRLTGTALAVSAALVVGVPVATQVLDDPPAQLDAARPGADFVPGPTRGSLADDAAFLAELVQQPWGRGPDAAQPSTDDKHVLFAGDVPGGRWSWVVAQVDGTWSGVWFVGPVGATADEMQIDGDANAEGIGATVVTRTDPLQAQGPLLVLAEPGDVVEVSEAPEIAADATVTRTYRPVETMEGVAVIAGPDVSAATAVRVIRGGETVYRVGNSAGFQLEPGSSADQAIEVAMLEARGAPDPAIVRSLLERLVAPTGLTAEDLTLEVLWGGPLSDEWPQPRAAVLGAELPSGALAVVGGWSWASGEASGPSVLQILPAGAPVRDRLVVMRSDVSTSRHGAETSSYLVIVGPEDAVSAQALAGERVLAEVALTAGVATLPFPAGTDHVVVTDGGGEVIADEPVGTVEDIGHAVDGPVG